MKNALEKKFLEGSHAIAEVVAKCKPEVVAAYPITPQTHIVEDLAKLKADGKLEAEYVYAESEFAAASIVLGASAAGSRTYTATTSQGLLLMTEVVYNIAGMRLPVVMTIANRAVGAPLNIWNDTQDTVTVRDAGWINLFAETLDEAVLLHLVAYKVGEKLGLPVIVNVDGFILTHTAEVVQMPSEELVEKFLPKRKPAHTLDSEKPESMGTYARPEHYYMFRKALHEDLQGSAKELKSALKEMKKLTGNMEEGLAEGYKNEDAEVLLVTVGSLMGTVRETVDLMREQGQKVGAVKVKALRPFPDEEVQKLVGKAKFVAVLDKNISLGTEGVLATEVRRALAGVCSADTESFVVGLGGKDITRGELMDIALRTKASNKTEIR